MGNHRACEKCVRGTSANRCYPHCNSCFKCGAWQPDEEDSRFCKNMGLCAKSTNRTSNALPIGHTLNNGRYRIERVLGEGGYGITYEAYDASLRKKVAVKEFFPAFALCRSSNGTDALCVKPNAEAALAHIRLRFHEEAVLLSSLKNVQEIVTVYHSFEDNKTAYYTMELLQGMDMQKHLQKHGAMSWQELSPIVIKILRALYATHQMGYIHRDITPDNIYLLQNGTVRLIDFGNARKFKETKQFTEIVKDKFAPPEQYKRYGNQGPWTDIYSLCVTIYYAMTGKLPRKATELAASMEALPPAHTLVDVPQEVSHALQIGMSADENKRYRSVADFTYAMFPGKPVLGDIIRQCSASATSNVNGQSGFSSGKNSTKPVQQPENPARPARQPKVTNNGGKQPMLVCSQGAWKGFYMYMAADKIYSFGRVPGKTIQYPDSSKDVSRNQCSIMARANGTVYIRDDGSSYGTWINGQRLTTGEWRTLNRGDAIVFGKEMYILY